MKRNLGGYLSLALRTVIIDILEIIFSAEDRPSDYPSLFKSLLVLFIFLVFQNGVVKFPSSRLFFSEELLELSPKILILLRLRRDNIIDSVSVGHLFASNDASLFDPIPTIDVIAVESPHLMSIEALMVARVPIF